jgi:hypothetical protein
VPTSPTLHDDDPATPSPPLEQSPFHNALTAPQTTTPYLTTSEFGAYSPPLSPVTNEQKKKHSRYHAEGLRQSSGSSVQPIVIATPAQRGGADSSGNITPPTPPMPTSPLKQAHLRNFYTAAQPTASCPTELEYVAFSPLAAASPAADEREHEEHGRRRRADGLQHASSTSPTGSSYWRGQPA